MGIVMASRSRGSSGKPAWRPLLALMALLQLALPQTALGQATAPDMPRNVGAPRMVPYAEAISNMEKRSAERPGAIPPRTAQDEAVRSPPEAQPLGPLPAPSPTSR